MAQFDLHRNKGPRKDTIPYLVIVQSALFDGYRRRLVVPLVRHVAADRKLTHLRGMC